MKVSSFEMPMQTKNHVSGIVVDIVNIQSKRKQKIALGKRNEIVPKLESKGPWKSIKEGKVVGTMRIVGNSNLKVHFLNWVFQKVVIGKVGCCSVQKRMGIKLRNRSFPYRQQQRALECFPGQEDAMNRSMQNF